MIGQDYRLPKNTSAALPNVERLAWSVGANTHIASKQQNFSVSPYLNIALMLSSFGDTTGLVGKFSSIDRLHLGARIEAGISVPGRSGNFRLFAGFEELSDDGVMPVPEKNRYFFLGFRFSGKELLQ